MSATADAIVRLNGEHSFDAAVHGETDVGAIDVGLAVQLNTFGFVLDAPVIGSLRGTVEILTDGRAALTSITRRGHDGVEAPLTTQEASLVAQMNEELGRYRHEMTQLRVDQQAQIDQLVVERDDARSRASVLDDQRKDDEAELKKLRAELAAFTAKHDSELTALRTAAENEKNTRITTIQEMASTDEKLRAELKRAQHDNAELQRRLTNALSSSTTAEQSRTQLAEEIETLKSSLVNVHDELKDLRAELKARNAELAAAKAAAETLRNESAARGSAEQQKHADAERELKQALEEKDNAFAELKRELAEARSEFEAERKKLLEQMQADKRAAAQKLEAEKSSLSAEKQAATDQLIAEKQALIDQLTADKQAITEQLVAEKQALTEQLATASDQTASANEQLANATAQLNALRDQSSNLPALQDELEQARSTIASLTTDLEQRDASLASAVEQKETALGEVTGLRVQLSTAQHQAKSSTELQDKLTELQQRYEADVTEAKALASKAAADMARLTAERDEARNIARTLHQKLAAAGGGGAS